MVKYYKTKPCVVKAVQWTGDNTEEIQEFAKNSIDFSSGRPVIHTLEGDMTASIGDFIIEGLKEEFYPCNPEAFDRKYEEC